MIFSAQERIIIHVFPLDFQNADFDRNSHFFITSVAWCDVSLEPHTSPHPSIQVYPKGTNTIAVAPTVVRTGELRVRGMCSC